MKTPNRILPLIEDGVIDEVLQQLMSGKEATVYVVRCGREIRCAKVYKEVAKRSFKQAVQYKEGRKGGNSRRQRAIDKGSKYGRKQQEAEWHDTEVNALYQLERAGVRVPEPFGCFDGVLLMELVTTEDGDVAPRLNDVVLTREQALEDHATVMSYVVKMLCLGMVHGDLSEFNVLVDDYGPVIIDLPQAVNAAGNNHARSMLERDINNITAYYGQSAPELLVGHYADEIWALYEAGELHPDTQLTGDYSRELVAADTDSILLEIEAALKDESDRLARIRDANEG
ncbi:MAG: serine protein kinase RIO [Luminiphilus sp.]|nr:serine protein kinase RIO [Luminiphilus sp.]MDG2037289.1 serine protein kinase RIO [Luminiphilus sp.]